MTNATKKLGKEIATKLKGIETKNPVERMATYFGGSSEHTSKNVCGS